ncbi:MAG: FeS assembly SUF system protein [Rickettsiales bacterium]|jgi:FeS assembly SUF system protein|nr:FeS assembly SUF system protein [Rickettsiales bacterium]|tara:strand:- start:604 stop:918 length:315 start_codon:yes stop_codon:yes gene_type:complete
MENNNIFKDDIVEALQSVYDPEIPVSIYELGLIYDIIIKDNGNVDIIMTLTTPHCPEAQTIPEKVADVVSLVKGVNEVKVEITWEPPWDQDKMTEAAKLELGLI